MDNVQSPATQNGGRNYGVDLLRIVSMFSIVLLHVLGEGGVGRYVEQFSSEYYGYLSLRFLNEYAVNAFGMLSGYVMCRSKTKISKLLSLWLQVMFYSVGISALFILFDRPGIPSVRAELYSMFLPITGSRYWYMSSYFGLFFLIPVLNAGLEKLSGREIFRTLAGLFILVCVLGSFNTSRNDPFSMNYGFSTAWLCVLYLAGGAYRMHGDKLRIHTWQAVLGIVLCVMATVLFKHNMDANRWRLSYTLDWMLMSNVSVTYTLTGFFVMTLFVRMKVGKKMQKLIRLLSPAALGVYLIHVHPMVWSHCFTDKFVFLSKLNWMLLLPAAIALAALIFALCLIVDLCRIRLFSLLKVDRICDNAQRLIERML